MINMLRHRTNQATNIWIITILVLCIILGVVTSTHLTLGIMLLLAILFLAALQFLGANAIIYFLAVFWILPWELPLGSSSKYLYGFSLPEAIAYAGVVLMLFITPSFTGQKKPSNILSDPAWFFLGLISLGALIASVNIETLRGFYTLRKSTIFLIAVLVICRYVLTNQKQIYRVLNFLLGSTLVFNALILLIPIFEGALFQRHRSYLNTLRAGGLYTIPGVGVFFFGPNTIGQIASIALTMAFTFALLVPDPKKKIFHWAVFVINALALVLSGSRGGLLSAAIPILIVIFYALRKQKWTRAIPSLIIAIMVFVLLLNYLPREITTRFQNYDPTTDLSARSRILLYEKALNLFLKNPYGIGYGTFLTLTDNYILSEQNIIANAATGGGFLGLIGLLGFYFIFFLRCIKRFFSEDSKTKFLFLAFLATGMTFFIGSMFIDSNANISVYFTWLMVGIIFAGISLPQSSDAVEIV